MKKFQIELRKIWVLIKNEYMRGLLDLRVAAKALANLVPGISFGAISPEAILKIKLIKATGEIIDYGIVSTKVITTVGVNYIVDGLQANTTDVALFRFHASGTGAIAEAIADTALGTQIGSRVSGTQGEGASTNIYQTVATLAYTATLAITEHGIFSALTAGTLLDRSVFTSINVVSGDSIQFTYELTVPSGS